MLSPVDRNFLFRGGCEKGSSTNGFKCMYYFEVTFEDEFLLSKRFCHLESWQSFTVKIDSFFTTVEWDTLQNYIIDAHTIHIFKKLLKCYLCFFFKCICFI